MVDGPEPVRLPAAGVRGWGLLPRYRTPDTLPGRAHHDHGAGDGAAPGSDADADADADHDHDRHADDEHGRRGEQPRHRSELWHDSAEGSAWRTSSAAIRGREEPGHVNRQA
ncbi:MAG: hypothetical protein R2761_23090 [Acidimicrobiales bacterium]